MSLPVPVHQVGVWKATCVSAAWTTVSSELATTEKELEKISKKKARAMHKIRKSGGKFYIHCSCAITADFTDNGLCVY